MSELLLQGRETSPVAGLQAIPAEPSDLRGLRLVLLAPGLPGLVMPPVKGVELGCGRHRNLAGVVGLGHEAHEITPDSFLSDYRYQQGVFLQSRELPLVDRERVGSASVAGT